MNTQTYGIEIDPAHEDMDIFDQPITQWVWREKYRYGDEEHPRDSFERVCRGVYKFDTNPNEQLRALRAMQLGLWVPGGRIHAGAGTDKIVTLINCYVCQTIGDSMDHIADALKDAMLTQQQGGGIGMNFGTLRPSGAFLKRTGAVASGPLPFMDMWDSMCATIMSAGSRRGAMMGTITDDHPDLLHFIEAKHTSGRLTNFNVSILVSDAFMDAVAQDEEWHLGFHVPRADGKHVAVVDKEDGPWYVYSIHPAREIWEAIMESTYEYSEPGVIFIDRINEQNNLNYCETIMCTNPCGEQPLPPNGACNLGAVNLARMVKRPFTPKASFNFDLLENIVDVGVRFLDNVIDVTHYPLDSQAVEEQTKRRIGLGITGLANALMMLGARYGSERSLQITENIMSTIKERAYRSSAMLAQEKGAFPLYSQDSWGKTQIVESLSPSTRNIISSYGIRNGVILTIAPTGTTSLYMGNISSGLEPVFAFQAQRKVRMPTVNKVQPEWQEFVVEDYAYRLFKKVHGTHPEAIEGAKNYMRTHENIAVESHVRIQSVCQRHVDASVSKTINCPEDISYEQFKLVYWDAYNLGCKGCTTYRPSDVRGSILSTSKDGTTAKEAGYKSLVSRPSALTGITYKVKWPNEDASYYITINDDDDGCPFEMFIASTSSKYSDWTTALSLMISAVMRLGYDITFIPEELKKVASHHDHAWIDGKWYGSLVALIGATIEEHLYNGDIGESDEGLSEEQVTPQIERVTTGTIGDVCPKCNTPNLIAQEGCKTCMNCGYSNCG